jgi:hypothetical protein
MKKEGNTKYPPIYPLKCFSSPNNIHHKGAKSDRSSNLSRKSETHRAAFLFDNDDCKMIIFYFRA